MDKQKELDKKLIEWGNILKEGIDSEEMNIFFDASDEDGYLCYLVISYIRKRRGKKPPTVIGTSTRIVGKDTLHTKTMLLNGPKAQEGFFTFDVPVGEAFPYVENIKLAIDNHLNLKSAPAVRTNIDAIWGTDKGEGKLLSNYNLNSVHILLACLKAVDIDILSDSLMLDNYFYDRDDGRLGYRLMYDLLSIGDCDYSTLTGDYEPTKVMAFGKDNSVGKNKQYAMTRKEWLKRLGLDNFHIENTFLQTNTPNLVFGLKENGAFRLHYIKKLIKQIDGEVKYGSFSDRGSRMYLLKKANINKDKKLIAQIYMNNNTDKKRHYAEKIVRID